MYYVYWNAYIDHPSWLSVLDRLNLSFLKYESAHRSRQYLVRCLHVCLFILFHHLGLDRLLRCHHGFRNNNIFSNYIQFWKFILFRPGLNYDAICHTWIEIYYRTSVWGFSCILVLSWYTKPVPLKLSLKKNVIIKHYYGRRYSIKTLS